MPAKHSSNIEFLGEYYIKDALNLSATFELNANSYHFSPRQPRIYPTTVRSDEYHEYEKYFRSRLSRKLFSSEFVNN